MPYAHELANHDHGWHVQHLLERVYTEVGRLDITAWCTPEPVPWADRRSGEERQLNPGDRWGTLFDCAWFRFTGSVPAAAAGRRLVALIDVNGELLVHDAQGTPLRGLTCVRSQFDLRHGRAGKRVMPLDDAAPGTAIELWADGGCNDLFGKLQGDGTIVEARLAVVDEPLLALAHDWEVLANLSWALPAGDERRARIIAVLDRFVRVLPVISSAEVAAARAALAPLLAERGAAGRFQITAIGHAHIDLAWLWPIRETKRKTARTIATVLRNLEQYPDYRFGISQPQQVAWLREEYPALAAQFAQRVAEDRIELHGGMWVESDTNLISGESMARQLLHGQRAWRAWYGKTSTIGWLPDVFGFSPALPQLFRQAGLEAFVTTKMSWSLVNHFPHHTFEWQGLDGTRLLTHFPPEGNYLSAAVPSTHLQIAREHRDAVQSPRAMQLFGIGDGGGGPGSDHLERLARVGDLSGMPIVRQDRIDSFFDAVRADAAVRPLPVWRGEMYLERHQGTYTTNGRMKRWNRQLEWRLLQTELACVRALGSGHAYPRAALDRIWKEVLLYQFHDILPGSSVHRVYVEAEARCAALMAELDALIADADARLPAGRLAAVNDLSWPRAEWVRTASGWRHVTVAPLAVAAVDDSAPALPTLTATPRLLDNGVLRVRLSADGRLESVLDLRHDREVLAGPGNDLVVIRDPADAWEIAIDHPDFPTEAPALVAERAGVDGAEAWIEQVRRVGASTITQRLVLTAGSARLDFRTEIEWHERQRMLRARFPTVIDPGSAQCECAFGSHARATHRNTAWNAAQFEVCAHSWVDLSERSYGVALLNDGKYGHRLLGGLIDLNLLRAPITPNTESDQGRHVFTYALFPHAGDHVSGGVLQAAQALNCPLRLVPGRGAAAAPVRLDGALAVSALKLAEDSDELVLRVYEPYGDTVRAQVHGLGAAALVNLLEEAPQALPSINKGVALTVPPFGVRTLRGPQTT